MAKGIDNSIAFAMLIVFFNIIIAIVLLSSSGTTQAGEWILDDLNGERTNAVYSTITLGNVEGDTLGITTDQTLLHKILKPNKGLTIDEITSLSQGGTTLNLDEESTREEFSIEDQSTTPIGDWGILETLLAVKNAITILTAFIFITFISPIVILVTIGSEVGTIALVLLSLMMIPLQIQAILLFVRMIMGKNRI